MEFTGERWVFEEGGDDLIQREHMARYVFACSHVKGKRVLDIACGVGFGSSLLLKQGQAKEVVGADIDPDSVAYATEKYGNKGLRFEVGDAQKLPFKDKSFEVVVSFETIEHLPDQAAYLAEMKRVLVPGGVFLVSTPDRDYYNVYNMGKINQFHVHELTKDEFKRVLKRYFSSVELFGQNAIDLPAWQKAKQREPYKRLLRSIDRIGLRKKVKAHLNRRTATDSSVPARIGTIYDSLDPTLSPIGKGPYVYLTAVCLKNNK